MAARHSDLALYRRLGLQARPFWPHLTGLFLLNLLSAALKLLTPLPLLIGVDCVVGSEPLPGFLAPFFPPDGPRPGAALLVVSAVLLVLIALLVQLVGLAHSLLSTYTGEKLVLDFRAMLFRHAQRLSLAHHDSRGTTDSTYRIQYDAPSIQWVVVEGVIPLLTAGFTVAAMLYVTAWIDWQLALVALAVAPVLFLLTHIFGRRVRRQSKELKKVESAALAVIQEVLSAVRVVKAFGQEQREEERFVSQSRQGVRARLRVLLAAGSLGLLVGLVIALGTAGVLFLGVRHVQNGSISLGQLLLVLAYVAQLYGPLETISKKMADLQGSLASADRAFSLLNEEPDVPERAGVLPLARARGALAFRGVSFGYGNRPAVLHDVSFEVAPGMRVGIAGKTGAGKTTLVSLLTRFYDPTAGQILLDGLDLRDYQLADLRKQFGFVLQEPVLFSASIAENIAYARSGASESDIISAAKAANAHEFIIRLPEGYETCVGERGMQISGGERQRLALARAFLKDAPILILDEPTSSVDVKTEALIMDALERLISGRTTLVIAHRLSTLKNCDLYLNLEHGRLIYVPAEGAVVRQDALDPLVQGSAADV